LGRAAMSAFVQRVRRVVRAIPRGTTLSYGEVALRAGKPRAARAVVAALHRLADVPWWRVARHDGTLAPQVAHQQAVLLRQEGWKGRPRARQRGETPERRPLYVVSELHLGDRSL